MTADPRTICRLFGIVVLSELLMICQINAVLSPLARFYLWNSSKGGCYNNENLLHSCSYKRERKPVSHYKCKTNVHQWNTYVIKLLLLHIYITRAIHKLILIVHYLFAWISHKISLIRTVYIDSRSSPYIANRKTVINSLLSIFYSTILVYNYCLLLYCITFRLPLAILISLHCFVWTCCYKATLLASVSPKIITCANTPNN